MCGLCGMFESGRRWLDDAATLDPAQVRRERRRRLAIVRRVLAPSRIAVGDWQGASFLLHGPTGKTEIVDNLFDLWRKAEALGSRDLDPLAPHLSQVRATPGELGDASGQQRESLSASSSFRGMPLSRNAAQTGIQSRLSATRGRPDRSLGSTSAKDTDERSDSSLPLASFEWRDPRLPVHVLTGFLGSGKTTLLNRMLRDPELADSAVLINEIGAVAIDHHLVERVESGDALEIIVLKGGCACCTVRGDLVTALRELYGRRAEGGLPPFRRVVLETTGLADPAPVLFTLAGDPALRHKFVRAGVIATLDAVHGAAQLEHYPESRKQIAAADFIVITKSDLAAGEAVSLANVARGINPAAVVEDVHAVRDLWRLFLTSCALRLPSSVSSPARRVSNYEGNPAAHHTSDVSSTAFAVERTFGWSPFAVWLTLLLHAHGDKMLRFKTLLHVEGWSGPIALDGLHHLVHRPIHLAERRDPSGPSQLVFIAQGLHMPAIEPSLLAFLALHSAPPARREPSPATSSHLV